MVKIAHVNLIEDMFNMKNGGLIEIHAMTPRWHTYDEKSENLKLRESLWFYLHDQVGFKLPIHDPMSNPKA